MNRKEFALVIAFYCLITVFFFRNYFFNSQVPFPANLLVSFYSPWNQSPQEGFPNGVPNKPIGSDNLRLFYPYRQFTTQELGNGRLPVWNPYVFSGNIHLATYQSAVMYPFNILYHLLPLIDAWSMLVILTPILAATGMYLFLRTLGLTWRGSLFGASTFSFSGIMMVWWEENIVLGHSVVWIPWALLGSSLLWRPRNRVLGVVLLSGALALSILAGFLQLTIYLILLVLIWNLYLLYEHLQNVHTQNTRYLFARATLWIFGGIALGLLLAAIQWLPGMEAYVLSPRSKVDSKFIFEIFLMPLWHLITLVAPDFWGNPGAYNYFYPIVSYHEKMIFVGIVPLVFALFAMCTSRSRLLRFWTFVAVISLSLGFALPTSWIWYVAKIPILSAGLPTRIFIVWAFAISVLAAFGMNTSLESVNKKLLKIPLLLVACALLGLWIFVLVAFGVKHYYPTIVSTCMSVSIEKIVSLCKYYHSIHIESWLSPYTSISLRNLIIPTGIFLSTTGVILYVRIQSVRYAALLLIFFVSSSLFAGKFLYFSERKFVYPELPVITTLKSLAGYDRVWSYGNAYIDKNISVALGIYSPEGYDALFPAEYGELLYRVKSDGSTIENPLRTDADLKQASEQERLGDNRFRLRAMSLTGVKYILESKSGEHKDDIEIRQKFPQEFFRNAWEDKSFRIWEYLSVLPRAAVYYSHDIVIDPQDRLARVFDENYDIQRTVVLEASPGVENSSRDLDADRATIVRYDPSYVEISLNAAHAGVLMLTDSYYPGWKAYVDGKEAQILRANYAFRAVSVNPGNHTVVFRYDPLSVRIGLAGSIGGMLVIISLLVYQYAIKKRVYS